MGVETPILFVFKNFRIFSIFSSQYIDFCNEMYWLRMYVKNYLKFFFVKIFLRSLRALYTRPTHELNKSTFDY